MGYQMVTWPMTSCDPPPKVLWDSTVGYPSDNLASCLTVGLYVTSQSRTRRRGLVFFT